MSFIKDGFFAAVVFVEVFWLLQLFSVRHWNMDKKRSFPLRISSVNVTKSAENSGIGHI